MIRLILIALFIVIFFVVGIFIWIAALFIGRFDKTKRDLLCLHAVQLAFKIILVLAGVKLTVYGEENVPKDEAVLYIGNHRSYFDIVITYARCPRLTGYVAKDSMLKVPFLRTWMKCLHCLFLNRANIKEGMKMLLTGIAQIKEGISMCIFPEGTRGTGETELDMLPFHAGSFKMAEKTGCAVIPMALLHTADIFEKHLPFVHRAHVILTYGEPIYPDKLDKGQRKRLAAYTQDVIAQMLKDEMERA